MSDSPDVQPDSPIRPYQRHPDGPIERDGTFIVSFVVEVQAATLTLDQKMPTLLFEFHTMNGTKLPPIVLALSPEHMLSFVQLVAAAARDAVTFAAQ